MKLRNKVGCWLLTCCFLWNFFTAPTFSSEAYGHVYCRSSAKEKQIALTFDDGPHPRYTKEILSILEEYHIPATFFIIGINAEQYPDMLQKIVDSGCEIGNHTYSHKRISSLSEEELTKEIIRCEEALYRLVGIRPHVFRPPEGMMNPSLQALMNKKRYHVVLWSIDTLDWALNPSSAITQTVMKELKGGDIILMHDYVSGGNTTCDALRRIIPEILAKGYEFVTVSELIQGDSP
ncbi:MAG: polysaccharide deacetylase family protein [Ruminococcaceae bacterium]|nr:polysaccharide deacetylase family protein [Oscillospiraceae bacterium]